MIKLNGIEKMTNEQKYKYMLILLEGQLSSEKNDLANLSNAAAIIKAVMDRLNWAGFYICTRKYIGTWNVPRLASL